jgi:hypothetical protein
MKYLLALAFAVFLAPSCDAEAGVFERVALIAIVFSADGTGYADHVALFDDQEKCESFRATFTKTLLQQHGKDAFIYSICTKPKGLGALEA